MFEFEFAQIPLVSLAPPALERRANRRRDRRAVLAQRLERLLRRRADSRQRPPELAGVPLALGPPRQLVALGCLGVPERHLDVAVWHLAALPARHPLVERPLDPVLDPLEQVVVERPGGIERLQGHLERGEFGLDGLACIVAGSHPGEHRLDVVPGTPQRRRAESGREQVPHTFLESVGLVDDHQRPLVEQPGQQPT